MGRERWACWALCGLAAAALCVGGASAVGPAIGEAPRAMSPNRTEQSYGARLQETALGSYAADGMRQAAGTDIAVECGGHFVNSLPGGPITEEDACRVFAGDVKVVVVELTCAQLFDLLEYGVGMARIDGAERLDAGSGSDCFPQISGFSFEFDVSQLPGQRLRRVEMDGGIVLHREDGRVLAAALPEDLLDGALGYTGLAGVEGSLVGGQRELLAAHIVYQGQVSIPSGGRITMVGSSDATLYDSLRIGTLLPYILLVVILFRLLWRGRRRKET